MNRTLAIALKRLTIAAIGSLFSVTAAHAGFTTIKNNPTEADQMQIIAHTFGGSWHAEDGDFYCGSMSAKRVDDFLVNAGVMNIATGQIGDAPASRSGSPTRVTRRSRPSSPSAARR